ncbi:hypothetical protein MKW94_008726 [Papaver nudicaule]|uniref:EXS domain-containing protein n=1 Tax=Papaver nudicaule TaxID=74823 RepID=A0AA42ASP6_PAPNU|nr:hypothetical protein [Papaver nudicaule]
MFLLIHLLGVPQVDAIFGPKSFAALIFTCLPFMFRLVQSLRLGFSGKKIQFLNVVKLVLTMSVTALSSWKFLLDDEETCSTTILSVDNIGLSKYDLLRTPDRPVLPSKIVTEEKQWVWYVLIVVDFILRLSWTLRLSISLFTSSWITLTMSILEILRRSLWMIVRIEAEIEDMRLTDQRRNGAGNDVGP